MTMVGFTRWSTSAIQSEHHGMATTARAVFGEGMLAIGDYISRGYVEFNSLGGM